MNIYFACSVTGGRQDESAYRAIVDALLADGHEVPTAHLASQDVLSYEVLVEPEEVYTRDIAWIEASDTLIAEVSTPSHGVGYEIAYALCFGKPVLCCFRDGRRVSKMITGNDQPGLSVKSYQTTDEAVEIVRAHLEKLG